MEGHRSKRIAEAMREEVAEIINYELDDPRIQSVCVTEVLLSPGGKQAHVRLAIEGTAAQQTESLERIQRASGYIRHVLAERIEVFRMPEIRFFADISPELRAKSKAVLRRIRRNRPRDVSPGGEEPKKSPK
jgi:ribosome-binding factor A